MKKLLLVAIILFFQNSFSKPIAETQKLAVSFKVWDF